MQVPVLVARKSIILTQHLALQFIVTRYGEKRPHTVNVFLLNKASLMGVCYHGAKWIASELILNPKTNYLCNTQEIRMRCVFHA